MQGGKLLKSSKTDPKVAAGKDSLAELGIRTHSGESRNTQQLVCNACGEYCDAHCDFAGAVLGSVSGRLRNGRHDETFSESRCCCEMGTFLRVGRIPDSIVHCGGDCVRLTPLWLIEYFFERAVAFLWPRTKLMLFWMAPRPAKWQLIHTILTCGSAQEVAIYRTVT